MKTLLTYQKLIVALFAIVFALTLHGVSHAQTYTHIYIDAVNGVNTPTGRGSATSPYKSITYALLISSKSDLPDPWHVHIHPGIYNADPAKPAAEREVFPLNLRSDMIFEGTTTAQECIIDAQHLGATQTEILRGIDIEAVTIRNLTLQNMNRTTSGAGGITLWSSVKTIGVSSTIAGCIVQNNGGGGVRTNEPLILTRNSFINNGSKYDDVGGVLAENSVVATQNTFRNNNEFGLSIKGNSTGNISDNIFVHHGHGACNVDGTFTGDITQNTFDSNRAGDSDTAGGFSSDTLVGNLTNNIFTNNTGNGAGGFYVGEHLTGNVTHNTFTNNTGEHENHGTGGGFFAQYLTGN